MLTDMNFKLILSGMVNDIRDFNVDTQRSNNSESGSTKSNKRVRINENENGNEEVILSQSTENHSDYSQHSQESSQSTDLESDGNEGEEGEESTGQQRKKSRKSTGNLRLTFRLYIVWNPCTRFCKLGHTTATDDELQRRYKTYMTEFCYKT